MQARLLAVSAHHWGDLLHALPISSCGCTWITKLLELLWVYVLEPDFVNHIRALAAPRSTRKTHSVSPADTAPEEYLVNMHAPNDLVWGAL